MAFVHQPLRRKPHSLISVLYYSCCYQSAFIRILFFSVRIREAKKNKTPVIDVDGSYLFQKHQQLLSQGLPLVPLDIPSTPLTGWEPVNASNYFEMAKKIPHLTSGRNSNFFVINPSLPSLMN